jgi:hypothetical protein
MLWMGEGEVIDCEAALTRRRVGVERLGFLEALNVAFVTCFWMLQLGAERVGTVLQFG